MLFAHLKRILRLDRLRQRSPNGAKDEFLLADTAQNLRKLAKAHPAPGARIHHMRRRGSASLRLASPATTSGAHRHLQSAGYFNAIRRLRPSAVRKYRPFADGLVNGSNRP